MLPMLATTLTWGPATTLTWGPAIYYAFGAVRGFVSPLYCPAQGEELLENKILSEMISKLDELRKDIFFVKTPHLQGEACAGGINFFIGPKPVLLLHAPYANMNLNSEIEDMEDNDMAFTVLHECAHIINNDNVINPSIAATISVVTAFALPFVKSLLPGRLQISLYVLPGFIGMQTLWLMNKNCEKRVDEYALKKASTAQLLAAERSFEVNIALNKELNKHFPQTFSKDGEFSGDDEHPPLNKRLYNIREEIKIRSNVQSRNLACDEEKKKMKKIRNYLISCYEEEMELDIPYAIKLQMKSIWN